MPSLDMFKDLVKHERKKKTITDVGKMSVLHVRATWNICHSHSALMTATPQSGLITHSYHEKGQIIFYS